MKWVITIDLETPPAERDAEGVGNFGKTRMERISAAPSLPFIFRLLDDDGEIYYGGRADEKGFGPLDWAKCYAGCTSIQFKDGERWETL